MRSFTSVFGERHQLIHFHLTGIITKDPSTPWTSTNAMPSAGLTFCAGSSRRTSETTVTVPTFTDESWVIRSFKMIISAMSELPMKKIFRIHFNWEKLFLAWLSCRPWHEYHKQLGHVNKFDMFVLSTSKCGGVFFYLRSKCYQSRM